MTRHPIIVTYGDVVNWLRIQWTDEDTYRARNLVEFAAGKVPDWIRAHVFVRTISGYKNVQIYERSRPGMAGVNKILGDGFFKAAGALMSVGFQTYDDWNRGDLTGSQKLGRASIAILDGVTPLGLVHFGASMVWPKQTDQFTADIFSNRDPVVNVLSDWILKFGGKPFQQWSMKPHWIDFF